MDKKTVRQRTYTLVLAALFLAIGMVLPIFTGQIRVVMTGVASVPFTWEIFLTDAFLTAIPGMILQLVFIPILMVILDRTHLVRFRKEGASTAVQES